VERQALNLCLSISGGRTSVYLFWQSANEHLLNAALFAASVLLALLGLLDGPVSAIAAAAITVSAGLLLWSNGTSLNDSAVLTSLVSAATGTAFRCAIDSRQETAHSQVTHYEMALLGAVAALGKARDAAERANHAISMRY
jgi:membrane protein implicated in regulation of membrane protease activity